MKDEKKAPKLRFKGFTDDWEQCKLSDISEKSYEKNTYNKYSTVLTNSAEYGIVKQRDFFDKDIANSSNISGYYVVRKNYFVYNPRISNQAKFGPINRNKLDESGIMSPLYLVFTVHDIDESFLETLFQTTTWHRFMYQNGDTGARADRFAIKDSTFMSMPIKVPSLEEQHKLALAFQKLDQTITLHEEKKRQLERLKSALLKKMFADKSGYPAVRFEGFGGKWDQCKLGNVGTFRGGFGFPENEQGNIDGIAFYKVSDMNDSCNTLTMRKASNYVTSSQISKNKWKPILNQNIIFAKVGAAVYLERKRKAMGPFLLDNNMMAFQPKDADIDYIYYVFQRLRISKHAQVGTLPSLNASELRNITIYIPSLNEQKAVADLMVSLDHTIILYDFKLELLKKLKSSLLQHMFI
ncbi:MULTISPECIES: restriction endonuclease subunit S [Lactobacillales]|uniref:restriction endonuclease subunit S n=1 Tax=Lactobacillales TaxID=186826 RepID=UPI001A9891CA|nr:MULTISPECIES: restriction endonuclease subunit S [Lactobacillales]MBO1149369.1 restriction endonuclease subunit S [Streptococcus thermophilus]MBO1170109.1 restriction endonuclease subunit S [Lactobacillus delbrueckii subsp. lactis]MBO1171875.1 restriction endonuclease subunit S [Lactobacillus delbrueckii subsp. lactis]MBO1176962.1 restriction endonuclease subunit S [Lactobacillus delbrueckii subsp. lactis]MBO1178779.1 restriction endonuclease subunit S [Lactobacillus delbrueckii subsp. lact